jgi:hypothetical protein
MDPIEYTVVDGFIQNPGKFERQPRWLPHMWDMVLDGYGDDEENDGEIVTKLAVLFEDVQKYPELERIGVIEIWETNEGFIHYRILR